MLSLDLLGQVLDRLCDRGTARHAASSAAPLSALRVLCWDLLPRLHLLLPFPVLERLDLSSYTSLDDASLPATVADAGGGLAGCRLW